MDNNIIIPRQRELDWKVAQFQKDGFDGMHVVTDFDRTLTKGFLAGSKVNSIIGFIREEGYLSEDYTQKAYELFHEYHPIEIDSKISLEEKKGKDAQVVDEAL